MRSLLAFIFGVYVGQEYGKMIPNVKMKTYELLESLRETDLYRDITELKEPKGPKGA